MLGPPWHQTTLNRRLQAFERVTIPQSMTEDQWERLVSPLQWECSFATDTEFVELFGVSDGRFRLWSS